MKVFPGLQCEVQRVCRPSQLPRPEITMTVLLVQVGKDQKDEEGHGPGNQYQTCGNAIHGLTLPFSRALVARMELGSA